MDAIIKHAAVSTDSAESNIPNGYDAELYRIRHSCAHLLAQAVLAQYPDAKLGIGPPVEDGFYYDFELPTPLTPEDLTAIEATMKELIKEELDFVRHEPESTSMRQKFAQQPYKLELMRTISERHADAGGDNAEGENPILSTYTQSTFEDLCRGPHVGNTRDIDPDAVKLLHTAGAYWRGDASRPMLQRIYGTAWRSAADLEAYLQRLEDAKKRDHRVLSRNLDFFSTSEAVGPGLILWHPKGAMVRFLAERFSQQAHLLNGYDWVYTPHIGRAGLWQTSGHLDFYKDSMYSPIEIDGDEYYLKPMSCPFHAEIYKSRPRSYRDLPVRYAEYAQVYRYELSGTLNGMTRVRGFCQDDAHTFCLPEQIDAEIRHALRFSLYVLRTFGLKDFKAYISTRPEKKSIGTPAEWDRATGQLQEAVVQEGLPYEIDEGGGAFYGPKIDLKVQDSLGREWQLSTIQFDFNLPGRFDLQYTGADSQPHRPYMVHRALFGSAERFFAMLVEHYGGAFPLWLAPTQVSLVPVTDAHLEYAFAVSDELKRAGMRSEVNGGDGRMSGKIREAQMEKIPYVLVVGNKEKDNGTVSVRSRETGDVGSMALEAFLELTREAREQGNATILT